MAFRYSVSLAKILKDIPFEILHMPKDPSEIFITSRDINRPGLILSGFEEFFDNSRINYLGKTEIEYIISISEEERRNRVGLFMSKRPACVVVARSLECPDVLLELAERITRHGVFVEVYGEGVLILGDSGVGKSESAVELIKRGHRLIADDAVEIKKTGSKTIVGSAPENIRHFIELRGIGIINARRIFGMGAVKTSDKIDMVIQLEPWDSEKVYDRMGMDNEYTEILDVRVPYTVIPVKPGRNLAVIIEVAAMNNRQKKMGYNAARELMHNLGMTDDIMPQEDEIKMWGNF